MGSWFVNNKTLVERFFVFNLATLDADYLEEMLKGFDPKIGKAGADVVQIGYSIHRSLCDIDLATYDQGQRYDFNMLIMTHGRTLYKYNDISMKIRATFLNPVFEHLQTVITHAEGAQDGVQYFLAACPLHKLWPYSKTLQKFISLASMPINFASSVLNLFAFFNFDQVIVAMHLGAVELVKSSFTDMRAKLSSKLMSLVTQLLSDKSSEWKYSFGVDIGTVLPSESTFHDDLHDAELILNSAKSTQTVSEANFFLKTLPRSLSLFGDNISIADYILDRLSNDLTRIMLFNMLKNVSALTDSSQVVWTFFTESYQVFMTAIYNKVNANSCFAGPSLDEQANALLGKGSLAPPGVQDSTRLVAPLAQQLSAFVNGGHEATKYVSFVQRFSGEGQSYSTAFFMQIFRSLGINAALYLDCTLIKLCSDFMRKLIMAFNSKSSDIAIMPKAF